MCICDYVHVHVWLKKEKVNCISVIGSIVLYFLNKNILEEKKTHARSGSTTPHETEHDGNRFTFVHTRGGSDGAEVAVADHLKSITVKSIELGDSLKIINTETRWDRCCCYGYKYLYFKRKVEPAAVTMSR